MKNPVRTSSGELSSAEDMYSGNGREEEYRDQSGPSLKKTSRALRRLVARADCSRKKTVRALKRIRKAELRSKGIGARLAEKDVSERGGNQT